MNVLASRMAGSLVCLVCLATLLTAGCGGDTRPADRPETVPVQGMVTYQGQPVAGATITFHADAAAAPGARGAAGRTDEQGHFQLTTFDPGDGAIPGNYRVAITKMESAAEEVLDPTAPPPPPPKALLPEKFGDPNTSGLTAEVKKDGPNEFPFDLGS